MIRNISIFMYRLFMGDNAEVSHSAQAGEVQSRATKARLFNKICYGAVLTAIIYVGAHIITFFIR